MTVKMENPAMQWTGYQQSRADLCLLLCRIRLVNVKKSCHVAQLNLNPSLNVDALNLTQIKMIDCSFNTKICIANRQFVHWVVENDHLSNIAPSVHSVWGTTVILTLVTIHCWGITIGTDLEKG